MPSARCFSTTPMVWKQLADYDGSGDLMPVQEGDREDGSGDTMSVQEGDRDDVSGDRTESDQVYILVKLLLTS